MMKKKWLDETIQKKSKSDYELLKRKDRVSTNYSPLFNFFSNWNNEKKKIIYLVDIEGMNKYGLGVGVGVGGGGGSYFLFLVLDTFFFFIIN